MDKQVLQISTDIADVHIDEGVLYIQFLVDVIELVPLKKHNAELDLAFANLFPLPFVIMSTTTAKGVEKEVRDYSNSAENIARMTCMAVLVPSTFMRMIANLFMKFVKMPIPMQLFTDKAAAMSWAKTFIK